MSICSRSVERIFYFLLQATCYRMRYRRDWKHSRVDHLGSHCSIMYKNIIWATFQHLLILAKHLLFYEIGFFCFFMRKSNLPYFHTIIKPVIKFISPLHGRFWNENMLCYHDEFSKYNSRIKYYKTFNSLIFAKIHSQSYFFLFQYLKIW